ncbi:Ribophorin II [Cladobotryum mycophilum]|uniref:Ribophorin II n=1 Tax=Cladobotryum mycophilum TaxID=491253 RepID=A0ABR0SK15_9HYPO
MRFSIAPILLALASAANAASTWGFSDGTVTISTKGGSNVVEKFSTTERVQDALTLGHQDKLKVTLTTKDGSKAKRPHQAFLIVKESSGLEAPFPLILKESGKGTVEITQKDLPVQLLVSQSPLEVSLVVGSFGSTKGSVIPVFDLTLKLDANSPVPSYEAPLRYGKLAEIHHIFRGDPKNPPRLSRSHLLSQYWLLFHPCSSGYWFLLGGNVSHVTKALGSAPISHVAFFGSIIAMEGAFFLYYTQWNLFQTLPVMGIVGVTTFLSGTKALGEVQRRRLAGERPFKFPTVEETLSHPAYESALWDLQPDQKGLLAVANGRGGPLNIEWEIHGTGPIKVALIMGLAGTKTSWQRQTKYFGHDRSSQYSILLVDNRGIGGSDKPFSRYSTSEMALDFIEVLDHVGWTAEREFHLAGISMGGMIAQEVACRIPTRLVGLSLLCTTANYESNPMTFWEKMAQRASFVVAKSEEQTIQETAQKLFHDEFLAAPDDVSQLPTKETHKCGPAKGSPDGGYIPFDSNFQRFQAQELTKRRVPGWWTTGGFVSQLLAAGWHKKSPEQLREMADKVGRERIMVMHGTADNMVVVSNGEKLIKWIEPAVGLIVEGLGHAPVMERTDWFNSVFEERLIACAKLT